ncbi:response regulator [Horticoccus sp. 23ND18S-11]|uniref:response regulator n=1 Tax=Horticoccus sp. 23ND18S-11 TaxID=3391832 RepID=UPI0039C8DD0E
MIPGDTPPAPAAAPTKAPVLLVDDEQAMLDVYQAALSQFFDVVTAPNTAEASRHLQQRTFKVVVVDQFMPGENGMDFLARVRGDHPRMQRVLVTGYMKPEVLLRGVMEAKLFRYLSKPVRMSEMVTVIQAAIVAHDATGAAS